MSGNTGGMQIWSDGYRQMRMMYVPPNLGRCGKCERYFWVADCKELGYMKSGWTGEASPDDPPEWEAAPYVNQLGPDQILEAINQGLTKDDDQETNLRVQVLWGHNHQLRDSGVPLAASWKRPADFAPNVEQLILMMDRNFKTTVLDEGRLLAAELRRELGRYGEASAIYDTISRACVPKAVDALRQACRDENPWPINITPFLQ